MRIARRGRRVAVVTCREVSELDADGLAVAKALADVGLAPEPVVWDDPQVDWSRYVVALLRSTWDYPERRDEFLAWASRVDGLTRLLNPYEALRWNSSKRYLLDLQGAGLPVVPTHFIAPGEERRLPNEGGEFVVKPAVSAGSRNTARYGVGDVEEALTLVSRLLDQGRTVMIQPYLSSVDERGERLLVYLDGRFRHAGRKGPLLERGAGLVEGLFAPEDVTPADPSPVERAVADAAISLVAERFGPPAYARIDLVTDRDGGPLVLELELIEPSLFLAEAGGDPEPLALRVAAEAGAH